MPTIIVRPINLAEPGSYGERRKYLRLLRRLGNLKGEQSPEQVFELFDEIEELVLPRLRTDDGSPVEPVLDRLSANDFDRLLSAIAMESGLGEASKRASTDSSEATPASTPSG